jgi:polysaccharide biosynthesis transport protein
MTFVEFVCALRRGWLLLVVAAVAGAGLGAAAIAVQPVRYTASAKVFVAVDSDGTTASLLEGSNFVRQRVASYAELTTTPRVLGAAAESLGDGTDAADLRQQVSADGDLLTSILTVTSVDPISERASAVADAVTASLSKVVAELESGGRDGTGPVTLTLVQPATTAERAGTVGVVQGGTIGLAIGLAFGLAAALIRSSTDQRVRGAADLVDTDLDVLGRVRIGRVMDDSDAVRYDPTGERSAMFRMLCTTTFNAVPSNEHGARTIVVTAPTDPRVSTAVASDLADASAASGCATVLVRADLDDETIDAAALPQSRGRRSAATAAMSTPGLVDVLLGRTELERAIDRRLPAGVAVLGAGSSTSRSTELLRSGAFGALLDDLSSRFDVIVVVAPPVLSSTDAALVTARGGRALVVTTSGRTRRDDVRASVESLRLAGATPAGLVLAEATR